MAERGNCPWQKVASILEGGRFAMPLYDWAWGGSSDRSRCRCSSEYLHVVVPIDRRRGRIDTRGDPAARWRSGGHALRRATSQAQLHNEQSYFQTAAMSLHNRPGRSYSEVGTACFDSLASIRRRWAFHSSRHRPHVGRHIALIGEAGLLLDGPVRPRIGSATRQAQDSPDQQRSLH
jgi:hypothetical protein